MSRIRMGPWLAPLVAGAIALAGPPAVADEALSPEQTRSIERVIENYLLENPEVIVKAMERLQARRRAAEEKAARMALAANSRELRNDPTSPVTGDVNGDVTLIEFFDYRCGVCRRVHPIVKKLMQDDRRIRRIYKEWPILGPASVYAARAALASRYQGKYHTFHNALMEAQGGLTEKSVQAIAKRIGLDVPRLIEDMRRAEISDILKRNYSLAERLGLSGTPSFVVGDRLVRGGRDLQTMKTLVAEARTKK